MKTFHFSILLLLIVAVPESVSGATNSGIRSSSLHLLWPKMMNSVKNFDTLKFNKSLLYASSALSNSCKQNLMYLEQVRQLVANSQRDSATVLLTRLILTSIIMEEQKLYAIVDNYERLKNAKKLLAELLSIKFQMMAYDFITYQYVINRLKSHSRAHSEDQSEILPEFIKQKLVFTQRCLS